MQKLSEVLFAEGFSFTDSKSKLKLIKFCVCI